MAVPKKRTSISKKHIRKNIWKIKAYFIALKAFSLAKSISTDNSKIFLCNNPIIKLIVNNNLMVLGFL